MLTRYNIKSVALPPKKISTFLLPIEDDLGLRIHGLYSIPCECGRVYIGQPDRSIEVRLKEHERNIRLLQTDKSAVAKHGFNNIHKILFQDTAILSTKSGYLEHLIIEAIEMDLLPNNISRDEGLTLSRS
jgi:hypothetical protein